jgi:hypothetical protein
VITAEVKPESLQSVSVLVIVKVRGVLCYFGGFPNDERLVGPDVDYKLFSVEVSIAFCLCQVFGCCWLLVLQSGGSDMFRILLAMGWLLWPKYILPLEQGKR